MRKKILIALWIILAVGATFAVFVSYVFSPTPNLSLIHISEPTRLHKVSRMPSSA